MTQMMNRKTPAIRLRAFTATCAILTTAFVGTIANAQDQQFPDGITPSHVFGAMDQVDRTLDTLLVARQRRTPPSSKNMETAILPMHVYQMAVTCTNRSIELLGQSDFVEIKPQNYSPKDVKALAEQMLSNLQTYAASNSISGLPQDRNEFSDKTPSDVFDQSLRIFTKVSTLVGKVKITPNEVYAQVAAAVEDAKAILNERSSSFDLNAPQPQPGRKPSHVFAEALAVRSHLNSVREHFGLTVIPVPEPAGDYKIKPSDVFVQIQIIRGEINLLKLRAGNSTRATHIIAVTGKTPTDVWAQMSLVGHLANQMTTISVAGVDTDS